MTDYTHRSIIAILRGVHSDDIIEISDAIVDSGITQIEVTMNSPDPLTSIRKMVQYYSPNVLIGGGTVTTLTQVEAIAEIGGKFIVSPNTDVDIITHTKALGLASYPGCFTVSEAFTALQSGADGLKIFPADIMGAKGIKAMTAVLPKAAKIYVVGGINANNIDEYLTAGAAGCGLGGALYSPRDHASDVARAGRDFVKVWDQLNVRG